MTRAPGALGCPSALRIAESLRPLGIVRRREDALDIRIELRPAPDGFAALITVSGEHAGMRDLHSPGSDCTKLEADLTASLALLLDQRAESASAAQAPEPAQDERPAAEPQRKPPREPEPKAKPNAVRAAHRTKAEKKPRSALHLRADVGAGPAILLVGTIAPAAGASFWVAGESESAGLTLLSTTDEPSALGPGRVEVRWMGGSVRACTSVAGARTGLSLRWCAAAALAVLRGQARGYVRVTETVHRPWYAVGTGAVLDAPLDRRFGWFVDATALVPLHRESFSVVPMGAAFQTPYVGVLTMVGASLSID